MPGLISLAAQSFAGAKRGAVVTLSSASGQIAVDLGAGNNFAHTTTEDTTLAAPSNAAAGQSGVIAITQGAVARTMAFASAWKFPGGTVPTLTAAPGALDVLVYYVAGPSLVVCTLLKDVK
jgi:hypothetical protein